MRKGRKRILLTPEETRADVDRLIAYSYGSVVDALDRHEEFSRSYFGRRELRHPRFQAQYDARTAELQRRVREVAR